MAVKKEKKEMKQPSLDAQIRLAEIMNDSPRLVSLNGTEWEVRALRFGTQRLIAEKALYIKRNESNTFGDVIKDFSMNISSVVEVITLAILNDKMKIFKNGNPQEGYSDLFNNTKDTLEWDCNPSEFGEILFEILNMINIDFFFQVREVLDTFRASVTMKKRMRTKTEGQK